MAWVLKKTEEEQKVDVRLSLPGAMHTHLKDIADKSGVELAEVIRQALAYSLKRYSAEEKTRQRKEATASKA